MFHPREFTAIKTQNIIHFLWSAICRTFYISTLLSSSRVHKENKSVFTTICTAGQKVLDNGQTGFQEILQCVRHGTGAYWLRTSKVSVLTQYFISLQLCQLRNTYVFTMYLVTYSIEQGPSWESNRFQLVKKFLVFHGNRGFIITFSHARHLSLSHSTCTKIKKKEEIINTQLYVEWYATSWSLQNRAFLQWVSQSISHFSLFQLTAHNMLNTQMYHQHLLRVSVNVAPY